MELHSYAGPEAGLEALRILREARRSMPWLPPIPEESELLAAGPQIEVIDNDRDCIEHGYEL